MSEHGLGFHMLNHLQVGYLKYLSFLHEIDLFFNFKIFFYKNNIQVGIVLQDLGNLEIGIGTLSETL